MSQVAELRWRNGIEVAGESCPPPVQKFTDLELPPHSNTKLQELGYNVNPWCINTSRFNYNELDTPYKDVCSYVY